jgi:carboxypeptidase T
MPTYHVTIFGKNYDDMADLVRKYKIGVFRHTVRKLDDGGYRVDAYMDGRRIRALRAKGYKIERHEDADKLGKARQAEVGKGNRYKQPGPD